MRHGKKLQCTCENARAFRPLIWASRLSRRASLTVGIMRMSLSHYLNLMPEIPS